MIIFDIVMTLVKTSNGWAAISFPIIAIVSVIVVRRFSLIMLYSEEGCNTEKF